MAFQPNNLQRVLYWSPLEEYLQCPQRYLWHYGWETVDLGEGLGKPRQPPLLKSHEHSIMGTVIQHAIEHLYNDKMYLQPVGLLDRLYTLAEEKLTQQIGKYYVDWSKSPPREEMRQIIRDGIRGFIQTLKHNRLLGEYTGCEVDFQGWVTPDIAVGGCADLVIHQKGKIWIFDGKNSQKRGQYTNPDQLRWYALVHYLKYGRIPDRLAFIYYRFPAGTEEDGQVLSGLDEVPLQDSDLPRLTDLAVQARSDMAAGKWDPTPTPKGCTYCPFVTVCDARAQQRAENSAKRPRKPREEVPGGVTDLDFSNL